MVLGAGASANAATATFLFSDETGRNTKGTLIIEDYVPFGGTFVSWKYFSGDVLVYEVGASDVTAFSHNFDFTDDIGNVTDNVVRIESASSLFETGLDDPEGGVAKLWNLSLYPECVDDGTGCGGGDGPQVDSSPPFTYTWRLASLRTGGVPEPATWALMIGGFGLAGMHLRARRRKTA
jgi:PEP-CTERM motif